MPIKGRPLKLVVLNAGSVEIAAPNVVLLKPWRAETRFNRLNWKSRMSHKEVTISCMLVLSLVFSTPALEGAFAPWASNTDPTDV